MKINFSPDLLERNQDFAIERISAVSSPEDAVFPHVHKFYEILYVYSGEKTITINNSVISTLNMNNIAFVAPYQFHRTQTENGIHFKRTLINFTYNFIKTDDDKLNQKMFLCFNNPSNVINFESGQLNNIADIFQNILYEYNSKNDDFSEHIIKNQLRQLLLVASRSLMSKKEVSPDIVASSSYYPTIRNISNFVKSHYWEKLSLEVLSNEFGISRYVISREFPKVMGCSFSTYLNNIRIKKSIDLLMTTNHKIAAIAHDCGYDSVKHFNRMFKKQFDTTPTEYRKQNRLSSD